MLFFFSKVYSLSSCYPSNYSYTAIFIDSKNFYPFFFFNMYFYFFIY